MKGSISHYCTCRDGAGRQFGVRCPKLKPGGKHGQFEYRDRLVTTGRVRELRRRGFLTRKAAGGFGDHVDDLLKLAKGDRATLAQIGDLIFAATHRQGQLPAVADVRRRLGLGGTLDRTLTVREALELFYTAKKRSLRASTLKGYRQHIDQFLGPQLGDFPIDRCGALQITDLFDLIDERNAEIITAKAEGRPPVLPGDLRKRPRITGVATQHRILATLSNFFSWAMRQKPVRLVDFNPCDGVELPPETREPARTWTPEQVGVFLESSAGDRLHALYRLILVHGPRRGEAVGARRSAHDYAAGSLRILRPLLQFGGTIVESTPKTRAGERTQYLDADTNDLIRRDRLERTKEKLKWGPAYQDNDLIWCHEDGTPYSPEYVSRHFRDLAVAAGLPPIKLHEGRHTAATLRLEAGVDVKVVSEGLGHSTTVITQNLYQHVRRAMLDKATEAVVALLPKPKRTEATG